jgi:hypothetical protein
MAQTILRNYQHASRIFVDGHYRLSPKAGYLFYVEFDFNPMITNVSNTSAQELGMIVKSVSLPKFTIDTKIHNAYNRKNIIQNKINYDPVNITFHDDQAENVRNFWYDYYSFFYRDSDYADATYGIISKYQERPSFEWGYTPRDPGSYNSANAYQDYQYIQAIRIYSLFQGNFSEYELINPIITNFKHGDHVNGENAFLEHQMSVQFETVKYQTGYTTQNTAGGYIDLHYDSTKSPNPTQAGETAPGSNPQTITDLAYYNLQTAGGSVVPTPNTGALSAAFAFGTLSGITTGLMSSASANGGGFALPALGSLTSGISNSNIVGQQLRAASVSLAGTAANTLAGGVISGVTKGLGPQGTQIVSLAAAAIANPSAALATVENMAIKFAMGAVNRGVNSLAASVGNQLATGISTGLGQINTALAFDGATTFTGGLSNAFGDAQSSVSGLFSTSGGASVSFAGSTPALDYTSDLSSSSTFALSGSGFGSLSAAPAGNFGSLY